MPIDQRATHRHADAKPEDSHAGVCECTVLAAALGIAPEGVSLHYCLNVLQRRWAMTCRHGEQPDRTVAPMSEKWKDKRALTPVLAILIENAWAHDR